MDLNNLVVSKATMASMGVAILLLVAFAVGAMAFARKKYDGKYKAAIIGAMVYIAPVSLIYLVLRAGCGMFIAVEDLKNPLIEAVAYAIPQGIACFLMIFMFVKMYEKKDGAFGNSVSFGIGFGTIYALRVFGIGACTMLGTSFYINQYGIPALLEGATDDEYESLRDTMVAITESKWTEYIGKGVGVIAIASSLVLVSVLMCRAIQYGRKGMVWLLLLLVICLFFAWQYSLTCFGAMISMIVAIVVTVVFGAITYFFCKKVEIEVE